MNNEGTIADLRARKQALKLKLIEDRQLIRQDFQDLKADINPLKQAGKFVKNLLLPGHETKENNLLDVGLDAAVNMAVGSLVPSPKLAAIAPLLVKNALRHVAPPLKKGLLKSLKWVAAKTEDPVLEPEGISPEVG